MDLIVHGVAKSWTPLSDFHLNDMEKEIAILSSILEGRTRLSDFTFMHWRRKSQPTPVFLPGESQGRGSLVGCHLRGHTESDTTEATQQQQQQQQPVFLPGKYHEQRSLAGYGPWGIAKVGHDLVTKQTDTDKSQVPFIQPPPMVTILENSSTSSHQAIDKYVDRQIDQ